MKTVIEMAREAGMNLTPAQFSNVLEDEIDEFQLERFAELVRADERERIKAANAPEIEKINAHIKALEDAVFSEREACAKLVDHILKEGGGTWGDAIRARSNT